MDVFERHIHSAMRRLDDERLQVQCSLDDPEHSFRLELTVRIADGEILAAAATPNRIPFSRCQQAFSKVAALEGMRVGRGVMREIHRHMGGTKGCAHLLELIDDAVRLVAMMRLGSSAGYWEGKDGRSEEERIAEGMDTLRNSCLVYAEE